MHDAPRDWRWGISQVRLFCMLWGHASAHDPMQHTHLAYAMHLGKPIRILILPGARLPEDLCAGYADLQVAHIKEPEEGAEHIQAWLDALP
jgi:hypothetical protein